MFESEICCDEPLSKKLTLAASNCYSTQEAWHKKLRVAGRASCTLTWEVGGPIFVGQNSFDHHHQKLRYISIRFLTYPVAKEAQENEWWWCLHSYGSKKNHLIVANHRLRRCTRINAADNWIRASTTFWWWRKKASFPFGGWRLATKKITHAVVCANWVVLKLRTFLATRRQKDDDGQPKRSFTITTTYIVAWSSLRARAVVGMPGSH